MIELRKEGVKYKHLARRYGVNRGIVWKLVNVPGYSPSAKTMKKLGIRKEDRTRYRPDLGPDLGPRALARAAADEMSLSEWVKDVLERRLWEEER